MQDENGQTIDSAKVGKMFVTAVSFQWSEPSTSYNNQTNKHEAIAGHWNISATLSDKPTRYGNSQTMSLAVEQGIGQELARVLLPVIVADASRKAQQLADDSKAMLLALGERAQLCITDMPVK